MRCVQMSFLAIDKVGELAARAVCSVTIVITILRLKVRLLPLDATSAIGITSAYVVKMLWA